MYRILYFVAGVNTHVEVLREINIVSDDLRPAHIARLAIGFNGLFGLRVICRRRWFLPPFLLVFSSACVRHVPATNIPEARK